MNKDEAHVLITVQLGWSKPPGAQRGPCLADQKLRRRVHMPRLWVGVPDTSGTTTPVSDPRLVDPAT